MNNIINLKDKKRSWALFPVGSSDPTAPPVSPNRGESDDEADPKRQPEKQKIEMAWEAPEYVYMQKSSDWYWAVGIISLALILVAIFTRNLLFAIFAAVAGFTIALWGARKPKTITIVMTGNGVAIEGRRYPYQELISFWIHYNPPLIKEISFVTKSTFLPYLRVPLGNENPAEIHAFLIRFLPEKIQEESLIDIVARTLKF